MMYDMVGVTNTHCEITIVTHITAAGSLHTQRSVTVGSCTYLIVMFSCSAGWGHTGGTVDVGERITV